MNLEQLKAKLESKSQELSTALTGDNVEEIKSLTEEVTKLKSEIEVKSAALEAVNVQSIVETKTMDNKFQALMEGKSITVSLSEDFGLDMKTLLASGSGMYPPRTPLPYMFSGVTPGSALVNAVEKVRLGSVYETYYVQNTRTNNAAANAEGTAPTDNVDSFDEVTVTAKPVISWIPISEGLLRSLNGANLDQIKGDVLRMLNERIDAEMLTGTGVSRSLNTVVGVGNTGTIGSLGFGTSPLEYRRAIDYAAAVIEADGDYPAYLVINPKDRARIVNEKDSAGNYVWTTQDGWTTYNGLTLVADANVAVGTAWILGTQGLRIGMLDEATVEVGYDGNDWKSGKRTLRAMAHVGAICRPQSIFKLTISS